MKSPSMSEIKAHVLAGIQREQSRHRTAETIAANERQWTSAANAVLRRQQTDTVCEVVMHAINAAYKGLPV